MDSKAYPQNHSRTEQRIRGITDVTIMEQLSNVSQASNVAKMDFHSQIERWNRYQDLLDKVDEKCLKTQGDVRLKRNIKHNVKVLRDTEIAVLSTIGLTALLLVVAGATVHNIFSAIGGGFALIFVGLQVFTRLYPPSEIHFKCAPMLHIDEYAYMNKAIKNIPKVQRDPVVKLPEFEMSIPRSWLSQQGMLEFMDSLENIELGEAQK
jgi:hypothetical protein